MNKEIAEAWVAALRSGEYKQGSGWLNRDGKFCCLGVLCELAVKENVVSRWPSEETDGVMVYGAGNDVDSTLLPEEVSRWAGMSSFSGVFSGSETTLVDMNDSGSFSFDSIASEIESDYKAL